LVFFYDYAFIYTGGVLMRMVIADRRGIVAAAILRDLLSDVKPGGSVKMALEWHELLPLIKPTGRVTVLSAQIIPGFKTATELARRVKEINREAAFFVYNGTDEEYGPEVDFAIPRVPPGKLVANSIIPFLKTVIRDETVGQMPLFY
jgi:hypothetical protein